MSGKIAALVLVGTIVGVGSAYAQESAPGPGAVEVTYMPAGAAFFMSKGNSPSFGNYGFGTAATIRVNRYVGIEGEIASMIATSSDLQFGDLPAIPRRRTCSATPATPWWRSGQDTRSCRTRPAASAG